MTLLVFILLTVKYAASILNYTTGLKNRATGSD